MLKPFLLGCLLLLSHLVFCQAPKILSVAIQHKQQPIDNAVVKLLNPSDSSVLVTAISNIKGVASFPALAAGKYWVQVSFTGFVTQTKAITFPAEVLINIELQASVNTLQDVTVITKKPFLQKVQGKTIVNVEASVTNAGTTVLEVLEKLPGIIVDKSGAINMQGKTGVLVMIDDKPTYVSGTDLNNLLSSMSSQQVDQIELITNPSAKYDANGNAGIINIKTKKNKQVGFNGIATISAGQGKYAKSNNSLVLNYRNGKWNTFFNYSMNYNKGFTSIYAWREYYNSNGAVTAILEQPTYLQSDNINNTFKTGFDFFANKKVTIGASFTGSIINRNGSGEATAIWRKANNTIDSTIGTYSSSFNKFRNTATNVYAKQVLTKTQDISIDLDFLTYHIDNDQGFNNVLLTSGGYNNASHGNIPSRINIWSAKADYNWRFGATGKLDAGAKSSYINTDNIAAYEQFDGTTWKEDWGKSNHFLYKENIHALYASIEQKFKRFSYQLGLRYEYTHYDANQLGNAINKDSSFARNYDGLFPSGYISYQADSSNTFTFTTGRRLDRPAFQKLNPFVFIINKYTNQRGNPFFLPQFTWNFELSHQYKQLFTTTVSYSVIKNYFSQIFLNEGNGILAYTEGNVGKMQNVSIGETVQFSATNWWSVTAQALYNYKQFVGFLGNNITTNVSQLSANLNNQFKINTALSAELSGFYITGARNDIQELLRPTGQLAAGISMNVLKKKGTVKLNVRDMFYTQKMEGDTQFEGANEYFILLRDSRVVNLAFTYRFGKPTKTAKRNSGSATDEMQRAGGN